MIVLIVWAAPIIILVAVANSRGRSPAFGLLGLLGLIGLVIGLIVLLTTPSQKASAYGSAGVYPPPPPGVRPPGAPPALPAGWYTDPMGRFQHRYWSGTAWTANVSTNGNTSQDPL
jgi:hypothetical protein